MLRATACRLNKLQLAQQLPYAPDGSPVYRNGKETTNITGLRLLAKPLPVLLRLYDTTLKALEEVPPTAVYRTATEAITRQRMQIVKNAAGEAGEDGGEAAVEAVERNLGLGLIEEVIDIAEDEERLVKRMVEWKPWEDLIERPLPKQWEYFKASNFTEPLSHEYSECTQVSPSTTNPEQPA